MICSSCSDTHDTFLIFFLSDICILKVVVLFIGDFPVSNWSI